MTSSRRSAICVRRAISQSSGPSSAASAAYCDAVLVQIDIASFSPCIFARWVTGTSRPEVAIAFEPTGDDGAEAVLTKQDDIPMTLELFVRLEDGGIVKRRVELGPKTTRVRIDAPGRVRSVSANPRHDVLVDARSAIAGDLDFDGETDGFDILRCTRLVGRKYESTGAIGLWNAEETFDPRCDRDGDFDIDDDDIADLAESFGSLRGGR